MSSADLDRLEAPLLAAAWAEVGFGAKRTEISEVRWPHEIDYTFDVWNGGVCTKKEHTVRLYSGGNLTTMPSKLPGRLMTQPLAIAAMLGMVALGYACCADSPVSNMLLTPLGGRNIGIVILVVAVILHLAESVYCFFVIKQNLQQSVGAAMAWSFYAACVGWPVTRRVLQLKHVAKAPSKGK
eukprot:TRINITY_DN45635_c0_g1_i1.p1 TRINITY_DN45635_c0_g1~~TRINITY_DN45635_c0_g1_i1.p1  ORF type:complete len:183 (-),score=16.49 TRINITY_DN45635_c0_g1_i1:262-810(-)